MAPPTCVACARPFRANESLASLPDGQRIAFDPEHHRVWRICTDCREWNLLGAESAAMVLPEVAAHFAATAPSTGEGVTVGRVGRRLEILRVGEQAELVAGALSLADRHRELGRVGRAAMFFLVATIIVLGAMLLAGWSPGSWLIPMMIAWHAAMRLATTLRSRRLHLNRQGRTVILPLLTVLAGSTAAVMFGSIGERGVLSTLTATFVGALAYGLGTEWLATALTRVRLPSGRRIRASLPLLRAMTLRWEMATATIDVVPHGDKEPLDANDSLHVLTHLTEWVAGLPDETIDQAHALVSTTSSLAQVLALLPRGADTTHGELRLDDLPYTYWAALDLALSREQRSTQGIEAAREARAVAEIAEGLDDATT